MIEKKFAFVIAALALLFTSCSSTTSPTSNSVVTGPAVSVGAGSIRSYITKNDTGLVINFGVTVDDAALSALTRDTSLMVYFTSAHNNYWLVDYVTNDVAPYTAPHLDIYLLSMNDSIRNSITSSEDTISLPVYERSSKYERLSTLAKAGRGVYWADKTGPEWHGGPFKAALLLGSHQGVGVFKDVRVDKAFLQSNPTMESPVSDSIFYGFQAFGSYRIYPDPNTSGVHRIELDNLSRLVF